MASRSILKPFVALAVLANARDAALLHAFAVSLRSGNIEAHIAQFDPRHLQPIALPLVRQMACMCVSVADVGVAYGLECVGFLQS